MKEKIEKLQNTHFANVLSQEINVISFFEDETHYKVKKCETFDEGRIC